MSSFKTIFIINLICILLLCIIIFKSSKIEVTQPKIESDKIIIYQSDMNYSMSSSQKVHIKSNYAEFTTQLNSSLIFKNGVTLNIDDVIIKPHNLILNRQDKSFLAQNINLLGKTDLKIENAHISTKNKITTASNLNMVGPYPYKNNHSIKSLSSTHLKTNLNSLKQIQNRNKQLNKTDSVISKVMKQDDAHHPKETFSLISELIETPMGRLNIRIKLHKVIFSVGQQSISSNFAKYQSDRQQLVFYDEVVLHTEAEDQQTDYASLNLKTGVLIFNDLPQPFPIKI